MLPNRSLSVLLKSSKTDAFSEGVKVFVGCLGHEVCSYCSMARYLECRVSAPSSAPLLVDQRGFVLRRAYFVSTTKLLVAMLGLPASNFSGHSFRAGSATTGRM